MHIICYNVGDGRISPLTEFAERQDLYMVKRILCILLCFALLCSFVGCKNNDTTTGCYSTSEEMPYQIDNSADAVGVMNYLVENGKLNRHSVLFDYSGDEFEFRYAVIACGAKREPSNAVDFVSPSQTKGNIQGYIVLNNHICNCDGDECVIQTHGQYYGAFREAQKNSEKCILVYDVCVADSEAMPTITDRSLLEIVDHDIPEGTNGYDVTYIVTYDGQEILKFYTCVPIDDAIRKLFTEHLVIYSTNTKN